MTCPMKNRSGFSLTELLVAIVIIGILSMIAIPKYLGTTTVAKIVECKPLLMQIVALQEAYFQEMDRYAVDLNALNFTDPGSKYFEYSVEGDSASFTAKAMVRIDLKDGDGNNLKNEYVTINEKKEQGGTDKLRKVARW